MADQTLPTDEELRQRLTAEQYEVTQKGGTERAFTGAYVNTKDPGVYRCIVCNAELFRSDTKYDSGSGWPSFTEPRSEEHTSELQSLMRISYAVFCLKKKKHLNIQITTNNTPQIQ